VFHRASSPSSSVWQTLGWVDALGPSVEVNDYVGAVEVWADVVIGRVIGLVGVARDADVSAIAICHGARMMECLGKIVIKFLKMG
jgi:hypothetical protein